LKTTVYEGLPLTAIPDAVPLAGIVPDAITPDPDPEPPPEPPPLMPDDEPPKME
jgi:hypothetical protein